MNILFESYLYKESDLNSVLPAAFIKTLPGGEGQVTHVGYLGPQPGVINSHSIIILPKVFLNERNLVFGLYPPEELIALHSDRRIKDKFQQTGEFDFLFRISIWLYQAISNFSKRNENSDLTDFSDLSFVMGAGGQGRSALELVKSLIKFHQDNQGILTYIKQTNFKRKGSINWNKTVSRRNPIFHKDQVIYDKVDSKQRIANFDEELLQIFMSTLYDIKEEYGFRQTINSLFEPLSKTDFIRFKAGATRRLKQIRGKYFNDQLVRLWQLLYLYYERIEKQKSHTSRQERLLVRNFNVVFEDMVDSILSDPASVRLPANFKFQKDGKVVDHIFENTSLVGTSDTIYHIGDSKYYKAGASVNTYSVFKQYTYARNLIFENISRTNSYTLPPPLRYRDSLTEGYNPTPNFFISATVNKTLDSKNPELSFVNYHTPSYHFPNRLFDRDTLLLQHYNINFLYVLMAYVKPLGKDATAFRITLQKEFRNRLVTFLQKNFHFYIIVPTLLTIEDFVTRYFRLLAGKMYRPSDVENHIVIALSKPDDTIIINTLSKEASITPWEPA